MRIINGGRYFSRLDFRRATTGILNQANNTYLVICTQRGYCKYKRLLLVNFAAPHFQ